MKLIVKSKSVTFRRKEYATGDPIDVPDNIGRNLIKSGACEVPEKQKSEVRSQPATQISAETGKSVANQQSTIINKQSKGEKKDVNKKMSNSR